MRARGPEVLSSRLGPGHGGQARGRAVVTVPRIICLVGPTAVGKTDVAIQLAQSLNGEIINCDSRQFYRELNIGTAKPETRHLAAVPHHLIDCTGLSEPWSVADFIAAADRVVQKIQALNRRVVLVGGTAMYLQKFLFGLDKIPPIDPAVREEIRGELNRRGLSWLYEQLKKVDPAGAKRLSPNDRQRIVRALEVFRQTGRAIHEFWRPAAPRYDFLKIGLTWDRTKLYHRINDRVSAMVAKGLKDEACELWQRFPDNPVLQKTIGYAEWLQFGFKDDELVLSEIQKNSRRFAKRQLTWFRNDPDVNWWEPSESERLISFFQERL